MKINKNHLGMGWNSRFIVFLFILLSFFEVSLTQEGIPFISNYNLPVGFNNQNWSIVQDDQGTMLFANRRGILSQNGLGWNSLDIDVIPYAMAIDSVSGRIYIGSQNSYGYIERNPYGDYEYIQLSSEGTVYGTITDISFSEPFVYFYSSENISIYDPTHINQEKNIRSGLSESFTGYFIHDSDLFVNSADKGLHILNGDQLKFYPGGDLFDNVDINFFVNVSAQQTILGTDNSFLYLFDGNSFEDLVLKNEDYFFNAVITDASLLEGDELALATRTGGCAIIDIKSGETRHTINYQSGLPDDEIYSITTDRENGIWLTHEAGATRVDLILPIKNYNAFSGLEGNLAEAITFNNTLYISTSEGVYYLEPIKNYVEKEILVQRYPAVQPQKEQSIQADIQTPIAIEPEKTEQPSDSTKKKGRVSRFFSKIFQPEKSREPQVETDTVTPVQDPVPVQPESSRPASREPEYYSKKIAVLESLSYEFTKVQGLNAKCRQLMVCEGQLFVASNTGLFRIIRDKSEFIIPDAYIHVIYQVPDYPGIILAGTNTGIQKIDLSGSEIKIDKDFLPLNWAVYSIYKHGNTLWLGSDTRAIKVDAPNLINPRLDNIYNLSTTYSEKVIVHSYENKPTFFIPSGVFQYHEANEQITRIDSFFIQKDGFLRYIHSRDGNIWIYDQLNWRSLNSDDPILLNQTPYLRLFDEIKSLYADRDHKLWVIDGNNNISQISPIDSIIPGHFFESFLKRITSLKGGQLSLGEFSLEPGKLPLVFSVSSPFFLRADKIEYQYLIEGMDQPWSAWSTSADIAIQYLPPGTYSFHIRARNVLGMISTIKSAPFIIKPPFTQTWPFYVLLGIGLIILVIVISQLRQEKLLRDKKILEKRVEERTEEIERQKTEISRQKEEITDSISYGERIQKATLPPDDILDNLLSEYFILFKPRDIVSGDFYWISEKNDKLIIAIVDCTGHGVPGAFMSFLGNSMLTEIGNNYKITTASAILNRLRTKLKDALHHTGTKYEANDGMDMGLCIFDKTDLSLQFAGAYNTLYYIRNNQISKITGDKMPIGVHLREEKPFTNNKLQLQKGDVLYMFTDGYTDQFGGLKFKKFKILPFQELLLNIHHKKMKNQKSDLERTLSDWMGDHDQIDDILVFGMRI